MVRLFIENKEVELDNTVQFAITKQFEELSNPTIIINDWSKTVSIPFSQKNNELFGHIYNPDKVIVDGGTIGIYFNPLLKLNFRLEWNNAVIMSGYAKMNEVKQSGGKGTYEITLFGELGKVFSEMQKITFDTTSDLTDYIIDGNKYVDTYISRNLVFNSWNSTGQTSETLKETGETGYNVVDIIGFAPNNSFSDGFDYKTYQTSLNESHTFEETLGDSFTEATGVEPSTVIPDGLLPREIGEYRSYQQIPFIYWNKLFKIFQKKAEDITGYHFDLDSEWFNISNPYWYNLVYMLKALNSSNEESVTNYYFLAESNIPSYGSAMTEYVTAKYSPMVFMSGSSTESVPVVNYSNNTINLTNDYSVIFNTVFTFEINATRYVNLRINPNNGVSISLQFLNSSSEIVDEVKYLLVDTEYTGSTSGYFEVHRFERAGTGQFDCYPTLRLPLDRGKYGDYASIRVKTVWLNSNAPFLDGSNNPFTPTPSGYFGWISVRYYNAPINNPITAYVTRNRKRSNSHISMNDLWNNDYNLFGEILKYCKIYRIGIFVDDLKKQIRFVSLSKYFKENTITDWTNRVDKSKDFVIKPITFENKYVLFNYADNKTKNGEEYKEKYGVNYGDYRLVTEYNFNNSTINLFDKVSSSIMNTDNVLSWTNIYNNHKIIYSFPSEIFVNCKNKDKKYTDLFGSYFFHNGLASFVTGEPLNLRSVNISDDTPFQQGNDTYFYSQGLSTYLISCATYPKLDVVKGDNMCLFNIPKENYTYLNNYSGKASIYTNFWESYINERYNIQNKQISCYMDIKPSDYNRFDFNHLIKVGNQLCIVNKIYDYDVTNNETTKVDLITIQDIKGYTDNEFMDNNDFLSLSYTGMTYLGGTTGNAISINTIRSLSDVTFENGSKSYSTRGVLFSISGDTIYATRVEPYVDEEDLEFTLTIKNEHEALDFDITRYSVYPYPYISITDANDNVVTTLMPQTSYKLNWERTPTDTVDNHPTVVIETISGNYPPNVFDDWVVEDEMYQIGDDEYFLQKYSVSLTTKYQGNTTFRVTITDKQGWHQTKTYNIV